MNSSDVEFINWLNHEIQSDNPHDILYVETLQGVLKKFKELKENSVSTLDMANVLGQFICTELDWVEHNEQETKKLRRVLDFLKEQDLLPCEFLGDGETFMDVHSDWCEVHCSDDDQAYLECWDKYLEWKVKNED